MSQTVAHYLYPATLYASREPAMVSTVLGSCVTVCLYDPVVRVGGMNHFMLPVWNGEGLASPKYGDIAIEKLLQKVIQLGARKANLQAKIFGGADSRRETNVFRIGERNHELAFALISSLCLPIISSHVGGEKGRKILFNTASGEVMLKVLSGVAASKPSL